MTKNDQKKLTVNLITYNAEKYLPACLKALSEQSFKDWQILIIDNGSTDDTLRYIKENYPHFKIVEHKTNLGFAQSHNQAIAWTRSDYIMCLNQDVILDKEYLNEAVKFLDKNKKVASITGKLLKWDFTNGEKTNTIDSLGLELHKNYRVIDRLEGKADDGNHQVNEQVFGVSGAVPIYRRSSLEKVKIIGSKNRDEFFDEDFFAYKEDVDLAFRLRLAGFKAYYIAKAIAWHDRSVGNSHLQSNWRIASAHRKKNKMVNYLSYRNHLLMLYKNCFRNNLFSNFLTVAWYEARKFVFMILFNRVDNKHVQSYRNLKPLMKNKRKQIKKLITISPEDIRKWYR
jgi:GT2 family glycosyltransferase